MPRSKMWPYPLALGTHVVARARLLDLSGDVTLAGTIMRVMLPAAGKATVTYAVQVRSGGLIEVLADRTRPIDTSTEDGLEEWLARLDHEPDPLLLPGPESPYRRGEFELPTYQLQQSTTTDRFYLNGQSFPATTFTTTTTNTPLYLSSLYDTGDPNAGNSTI